MIRFHWYPFAEDQEEGSSCIYKYLYKHFERKEDEGDVESLTTQKQKLHPVAQTLLT